MTRVLDDSIRSKLKLQHTKERDKRVCDRIKAVLMYDDGYDYSEIGRVLLLSHEAIRKHIADYLEAQKLKPANGGSKPKLSSEEITEFSVHLESHNYTTVKAICAYVEKQYGVEYSVTGMNKFLYRIGFVYKKPKLVPGKLDSAKQEEFRLQYQLLKGNLAENEAIYFMDSVHPQYQARARYGWIRRGTDKTLPSNSGWKRKHIIGAIDITDLHVVQADKPKVNGEYIIEFLDKLEANTVGKEKIYLVCDNAGYHKSKIVKAHLKNSKIELIYLPPYSPNLNPIERLWKFMHGKTTVNRYFENFEKFSERIEQFFADITKYTSDLRKLINDNFQTITINHFCNS